MGTQNSYVNGYRGHVEFSNGAPNNKHNCPTSISSMKSDSSLVLACRTSQPPRTPTAKRKVRDKDSVECLSSGKLCKTSTLFGSATCNVETPRDCPASRKRANPTKQEKPTVSYGKNNTETSPEGERSTDQNDTTLESKQAQPTADTKDTTDASDVSNKVTTEVQNGGTVIPTTLSRRSILRNSRCSDVCNTLASKNTRDESGSEQRETDSYDMANRSFSRSQVSHRARSHNRGSTACAQKLHSVLTVKPRNDSNKRQCTCSPLRRKQPFKRSGATNSIESTSIRSFSSLSMQTHRVSSRVRPIDENHGCDSQKPHNSSRAGQWNPSNKRDRASQLRQRPAKRQRSYPPVVRSNSSSNGFQSNL